LACRYIDVQINGAYGYDFSDLPPADEFPTVEAQDSEYLRRLEFVASRLVETGVTSFVPTIIVSRTDSIKMPVRR
jgi:N-acetylglucosamine-6-phosphate deacetylase